MVQVGEDFKACNGCIIDTHFTTRGGVLAPDAFVADGASEERQRRKEEIWERHCKVTKWAAWLEGILANRRSELFYLGKCIYGRIWAGMPIGYHDGLV